MLEQIRSLIAAALDERDAAQTAVEAILAAAETEGRSELSEDETTKFDAARAELRSIDDKLADLEARKSDLEDIEARSAAAAEARKEIGVPSVVTVKSEPATYRNADEFLADAYKVHFRRGGDLRATEERLDRSQQEARDSFNTTEFRSTTGAFAGLVVPQYLTAQFAPTLTSGRPFLSQVSQQPLPPDGMTINIPRGQTATSVAVQSTQGDAVSNTTYAVSDVVVNVNTYAGQNVFSRQAFERGTGIGNIVLQDLYQQYATKTNVDALGGAGTLGTHKGVFAVSTGTTALTATSVSYTATSLTSAQAVFSAKLIKAIGLINERRYMPADLIVMHPRRWAWLLGGQDSTFRPLVDIAGSGYNDVGQGSPAGYGVVGSFAGVKVVTDGGISTAAGVSTDQDTVLVTRASDNLFWEAPGAPVGLTFEEVLGANLQVRVVAYGFSAFTAERYPTAIATLTGVGLTWLL
jgi:HK97 family phage major capsid protein